ncbi:intein [Sulfuritortus calidifontis]|uniref:Intein n=1 Tax=Sulfuritortus calidifontis TaxID=1914471 RepID=A0A4R3JRZ0_9PROT|nr:phage minor head protein [Sulfuritortus calidifontis]TCS69759.1 intein [Sulfuritortus calidifontis]
MAAAADPALRAALKRPFAEQVAFFRGKLGNLVPTATWRDIMRSQHDRAFMVAGAAKADLLADLAAAVDKAIHDGESLDAFRRRFGEIVQRHGWHGWTGEESAAGRAWRTRVIYQTNLSTSYAAGRLAQLKEGGYALWVYRHGGSRDPRPQHLAWNGLTLPADHDFWKTHYPPSAWNCFPGDTSVRCDAIAGQRAWYSGEMVELHTALGKRLRLTVNHPVLTRRGWVAAHELQKGDELIGACADVDAALNGIVHNEHPPARAEDLFEALSAQGLRIVPVAADDFYGDALGMEGEIHIAGADCGLMHEIEAARDELRTEGWLDLALHGCVEAAHVGGCAPMVPAIAAEAATLEHIEHSWLGDAQAHGDHARTGQAVTIEADDGALDVGIARVCRSPRLGQEALAPSVSTLDGLPRRAPGFCAVAQGNAGQAQRARECTATASALYRQLLDAGSGKIARDEIVEIGKFQWSGHVYDFTTSTGLILAGGIVVSNCSCYVVGARSAEGAARLGGKPGYTAPPAGWDVRDAKGRLPGVDEGWDYMPGASVLCADAHASGGRRCADFRLLETVADKAARLRHALGAALLKSALRRAFPIWAASEAESIPLVRLPDDDAVALGAAEARIARLSRQTYRKQEDRHGDLDASDYLMAQEVVDLAAVKDIQDNIDQAGNKTGTKSIVYVRPNEAGGYVLVVKATKTGRGLWVTSYRRLPTDVAERDAEIGRLLRGGGRKK